MKFFIDTANIEEIKQANALGVLDGVTTNPSLAAKAGRDERRHGIADPPLQAVHRRLQRARRRGLRRG